MNDYDDVRSALATLVRDEPALPTGAEDIERRGIRRRNRRRAAIGAAALVPVLAGGVAIAAWPGATPVQAPARTGPPAGQQVAVGFPVGSAVDAVIGALPPGVELGDLPMDIGWHSGGMLTLPLKGGASLTVAISGGTCTLSSSALNPAQASTVSYAVCTAWRAAGSPEITAASTPGPEQPELAAQ